MAGERRRAGRLRAALLGCALALAAVVPSAAAAGPACAAEARAGLVIDTGEQILRYCVVLPDGPVSGIELIELAADQRGLDYRLGFGGKAVCRLAGVGTDSGDCFDQFPLFWGYWRAGSDGSWRWSSTGAGDAVVDPGEIEGWVWGTGQDGSTHRRPPSTSFSQICASPTPGPGDEGGGTGGGGGETGGGNGGGGTGGGNGGSGSGGANAGANAGGGNGGAGAGSAGGAPDRASSGGGSTGGRPSAEAAAGGRSAAPNASGGTQTGPSAPAPAPTSGATSVSGAAELAAARTQPRAGPPVGALLALAAALALGLGGAYLLRRSRPGG